MTKRASSFTPELGERICHRLANGESLRTICQDDDMPAASTVCLWVIKDPLFAEQYARAREAQAEILAEQILQIADDGRNDTYVNADGVEIVNHDHINRSRLRVDARKWFASKVAPKKYGDRVDHDHSGKVNVEHTDAREFIGSRIAGIASRNGEASDPPRPNGKAVH